jgi:uncharacterized protein YeeX (DUF496 family)
MTINRKKKRIERAKDKVEENKIRKNQSAVELQHPLSACK